MGEFWGWGGVEGVIDLVIGRVSVDWRRRRVIRMDATRSSYEVKAGGAE